MTVTEVSTIVLTFVGLAVLRFGVPMLIMWLIKLGCCRVLHLEVRSAQAIE